MPTVEVNGARLWYDEAGSGPALLLLHGGLGDSGLWEPVVPFLAEQQARYEVADAEGDIHAGMEIDFEVWAPLGVDERMRNLWRATPDAEPLPDSVQPKPPRGGPAKPRLGEVAVPALVITASHDP